MQAIVTAGGIPQPDEPLYPYTQGIAKALVDVAGKPMVQWVLDAISDSKKVENVIIIGLTEESGVTCKKPLHFIPNQGRMLANIVTGIKKSLELNPKTEYVLLVSSDIPGLKAEHVDWLVEQIESEPADVYYGFVPRDMMEARYPNSKRTYTHLKGLDVCGADINAVHVNMAFEHLDTWENLIGTRKNPLKQAGIIGYDTLLLLLLRQLDVNGLVQRASKSIGVRGKAIAWQVAEPGMDVDKPHQLELMRADLAKQK